MMSFSTILDPRSTAFQKAFSLPLRQNRSQALVTPTRPRACMERQKVQFSKKEKKEKKAKVFVRAKSTSSPANSPRRREKDGFIYRPEAVISILALGFLSSMAYLANAGRRIAMDVSARAKRITWENSQSRRYKSRLGEKRFLESAIQATAATLSNTEDFLAKQTKRAELAEERLRELEVSSAEVDAATRRTNELKIQLKEKEAELDDKRLSTEENAKVLASIQADIDKRREALIIFEEEVKEAQRELSEAQQTASESLKSASAEKQHLQAVLEQKRAQLTEELAAKDNFMQLISEEESKLQNTETLVDQTLNDIEARRKKIDAVAMEAEQIGKIASQEKLALEAAIVREVRAEDIEDSLRHISEKQRVLRNQIQTSLKSEAQKAALCDDLRKEIEERDKVLQEQRAKLNVLNSGNKSTRRSGARENEGSTDPDASASEGWRIAADGTSPYDGFESAVIQGNVHSTAISDSIASAKTRPPIAPSMTGVNGVQAPVPAKRRRGRPRKTDGERSGEPSLARPKRGRGRPRTRPSDDIVKELVPKKKRGRPRKTAIAATQENTAPRSSSGSLTQNQDSVH